MKNFVKKLISLLCSVCLSFAVFVPFILVKAENPTYTIVSGTFQLGNFFYSRNDYYTGFSSTDIRLVVDYHSPSFIVIVGFSENPFVYGRNYSSSSYPASVPDGNKSNAETLSYNGHTYYYGYFYSASDRRLIELNSSFNTISDWYSASQNQSNALYYIKYAFGNEAVDPAPPPPVYGNLADVSYSSNIAGSGSESANNIDVIRWNNTVDNHNNLLPSDAVVDIRAVPGEYQASDKQSLLTKIYTDLILDYTSFATLANVPFSNGEKSFMWSDVVSRFGNPWTFGNFISMIQGDSYWYKQGWIYEVRLRIPSEDFTGEWIGIRNLTSSGVENSNNAIDNNGLNSTLIQTINNVNNINSTENNNFVTNNYYYNDYPIPESSSDLSDLTNPLQAILDAILSIPRKIGEKIQEVLSNIYEWLFVYEFDIQDFEEQKERMLEESGAFGEILTHLETMKENIDSHNGASYVPLITWSDVYVMNEIMIPAGTFNLGNLVAEDPMRTFYLLYQTIVSGYLYFTLFRFLYKKIIKTLRT